MLERARREQDKKEVGYVPKRTAFGEETPERSEVSDDDLARQLGLVESTDVNLEEIRKERDQLKNLIAEQRAKHNATREAFLEWQAGQREKGSAVRLFKQGLKAEGFKRLYAETAGSRLVSVAYHSELGDNSNNDTNEISAERMMSRRDLSSSRSRVISVARRRQ